MAIEIPHFDLPFRRDQHGVRQVEQDSNEDVDNCVFAVLATETGQRIEVPDFGRHAPEFRQGIDTEALARDVDEWEPRATVRIEEDDTFLPVNVDAAIAYVTRRES